MIYHNNRKPRLLIATQALDRNDPVLGFFVRWVEEFAKQCESVEVVCLRAGQYNVPDNVHVHSLGKERGIPRLARWYRALRHIVELRNRYDAVFVHMNPEYFVAAGWLWRLLGKRTALWYTHKNIDLKLRIAVLFADAVLTASKESFRLATPKAHVMGHGIDTDFFSPDPSVPRGAHALSAGRLMPSKRHDLALGKAREESRELRIAGSGPEQPKLEAVAEKLGVKAVFLGGLTQAQLRDEYRTAACLYHTSETGSLDKVVLEALACGLHVKTDDPALAYAESAGPEYVKEHHSLSRLIPRILETLHG